jgi:uncharacterized membrane protein
MRTEIPNDDERGCPMSQQEPEQEPREGEESDVSGRAGEAVSKVKEAAGGGGNGLASRVMRKEVLIPVAATAATAIAGVAARKGGVGGKVKQLGSDTAEDAGRKAARGAKEEITGGDGVGGLVGGAVSKLTGGGGKSHRPKTRRLQIQRWTDVAVPVERAFEAWTNFEDYPKFMHRVLSVQHKDEDNKVAWDEKIWFSKRQWEAEIVEQRDNELIAWKTVSGTAHAGVVSFHRLDDNLTRVMVTMDFRPSGLFEKMASGLRFVKRAVQADLARFKSYVEFEEAGLESPEQRLQQVEQEEKEEKEEKKRKDEENEQDEQARDRSQEDGGGARSESDEGEELEDDRDRESEREERQSRREERREKATV